MVTAIPFGDSDVTQVNAYPISRSSICCAHEKDISVQLNFHSAIATIELHGTSSLKNHTRQLAICEQRRGKQFDHDFHERSTLLSSIPIHRSRFRMQLRLALFVILVTAMATDAAKVCSRFERARIKSFQRQVRARVWKVRRR